MHSILKRDFLVINRKNKNSRNKKLKILWLQLLCETFKVKLFVYISPSYPRLKKNHVSTSIYCWENVNLAILTHEIKYARIVERIFPTRLCAGFSHSARRTTSLVFFNFPMVLNKLFRQQKIREFFNSKLNSSLTNWCQNSWS